MIAHFPDPYPGELLYSVLARFCERMQYPTHSNALLELFGARHAVPAIELPHQIERLARILPPGTKYTADYLIQKHTLLPYYAPFLPERSYNIILNNMKGDGIRTTQLVAGIIAGRVAPPEFFKSCPVCDHENIQKYGETYWNRLHQIRGVEVCPVHKVFLEPSNIRIRNLDDRHDLFTASSAELQASAVVVDPHAPGHQALLNVAHSAAFLLDEYTTRPGLTRINELHRDVLREHGCMTDKCKVRLRTVYQHLEKQCPETMLDALMCSVKKGVDGGWVGRLFRTTEKVIAPLRHLLIMAAFGLDAKSFFNRQLLTAVPRGPYPCLNPACPDHGSCSISTFQCKREKYGTAYVFECPKCHHRSSRNAAGDTIIRIIEFGPLWEERLKSLWGDGTISTSQIAKKLNAHIRSVKKRAAKLTLPFPRIASRITEADAADAPKIETESPNVLETKRTEWDDLRKRHAGASRKHLREYAPALFAWLYRNDRTWLKESSPPPRPKIRRFHKVDWEARDEQLAALVATAAIRLKRDPNYPRRITIAEIARTIKQRSALEQNIHKFPLTRIVLAGQTETTEQFAVRRINWTVQRLIAENRRTTRTQIARDSGIGPAAAKLPGVQEALTDAYERVSTCFELSARA